MRRGCAKIRRYSVSERRAALVVRELRWPLALRVIGTNPGKRVCKMH